MSRIAWMLTRMAFVRFAMIWFGITLFVLTLDLLTNVDDVLKLGGYELMLAYALHRLPGIANTFLPISVLLAMLLALTELGYRNELAAIWSAGISPFRMTAMFLPMALGLGLVHFALSDQAMPVAAPTLRDWSIGDYGEKQIKVGERDPVWMRAGTDILRAETANAEATELTNVRIFRRNARYLLDELIFAKSARLVDGNWKLSGVFAYSNTAQPPRQLAEMSYSGSVRPAKAGYRSGDPEEMTLRDISYFIDNDGFGIRPVWVYETWLHKRLSLLFTSLVMIALCVPLAARFRRGGGIGYFFAAGIALGFVYFLFDGLATTLGEIGLVQPLLAAWSPLAIFTALAAMIAFRSETV